MESKWFIFGWLRSMLYQNGYKLVCSQIVSLNLILWSKKKSKLLHFSYSKSHTSNQTTPRSSPPVTIFSFLFLHNLSLSQFHSHKGGLKKEEGKLMLYYGRTKGGSWAWNWLKRQKNGLDRDNLFDHPPVFHVSILSNHCNKILG